MPESISTAINPVSGYARNFTWEYIYDANGNIINETIPNSPDSTDYYYDEAGQLIEAINLTWDTYTEYDNGGNVTYKYVIRTDSTGENGFEEIYNFEYGNENWPDQLTKVNDKPITYDAIGNPLTYDGRTYTWTAGRELASITTADMSLSFKYNDSGLRTHKTVTQNGVTATYTYAWSQDNRLISQTDGTTTLYFIYDTNDEIIGFAKLTANSSELYYYVKNLQGDVYAIVDSNGTVVAEYLYDAWGYLLEITGSQADTIGIINPIRYRSYYYDTETGYYYLQSRYYDPLWGRFINKDIYSHTGATLLGGNMFAYCENNPISYIDPSGNSIFGFTNDGGLLEWFTTPWYTIKEPWQKNFGYNDLYDYSAKLINIWIDCLISEFYYNGMYWRVELWKGRYGISLGAEIGFYNKKRSILLGKPFHYDCSNIYFSMEFMLFLTDEEYNLTEIMYRSDESHWWLTGFIYNSQVRALLNGNPFTPDDLVLVAAIDFKTATMADEFETNLGKRRGDGWYETQRIGCKVFIIWANEYAEYVVE